MNSEILSKLVITNIASVSTLYTNENVSKHRDNRSRWAIIVKYEGETVYLSKGKKHISNVNNISILPKGCSYSWECVKAGHYSVIEFDCQFTSDEIMTFPVSNGEKIAMAIKRLELEKAKKNEFIRLECIKETYAILLGLLKAEPHKYSPSKKQQKIAPALDFIAKNYGQHLKNDDLAQLCNMSTVYFRKLFKEVMGKSPIEYIQTLKIEKAKEILKSDYGSISDIAYELGYQNIYDLSI